MNATEFKIFLQKLRKKTVQNSLRNIYIYIYFIFKISNTFNF